MSKKSYDPGPPKPKPLGQDDFFSTPRDLNPQPWLAAGRKQDLQKQLLALGLEWDKIKALQTLELQELLDEMGELD